MSKEKFEEILEIMNVKGPGNRHLWKKCLEDALSLEEPWKSRIFGCTEDYYCSQHKADKPFPQVEKMVQYFCNDKYDCNIASLRETFEIFGEKFFSHSLERMTPDFIRNGKYCCSIDFEYVKNSNLLSDINRRYHGNKSPRMMPLCKAIKEERIDIVKFLITEAKVELCPFTHGDSKLLKIEDSPFHLCLQEYNTVKSNIIKLLVENKIDIDVTVEGKSTYEHIMKLPSIFANEVIDLVKDVYRVPEKISLEDYNKLKDENMLLKTENLGLKMALEQMKIVFMKPTVIIQNKN